VLKKIVELETLLIVALRAEINSPVEHSHVFKIILPEFTGKITRSFSLYRI